MLFVMIHFLKVLRERVRDSTEESTLHVELFEKVIYELSVCMFFDPQKCAKLGFYFVFFLMRWQIFDERLIWPPAKFPQPDWVNQYCHNFKFIKTR